jgi:hypothetical protein
MRAGVISTAVRFCSAITRSYSDQSSWEPPAAVKISRSSSRRRSASSHGCGSSGPASSARPSTVAHCQPFRKVVVTCGRARRLASLTFPYVTKARTCSPVAGCAMTPALTREDWIVSSARSVATMASPLSWAARAQASVRVLIVLPPLS